MKGQQKEKRCPGCGVLLQCDNPEGQGFTPVSQYSREGAFCRRCFRLTHYGELSRAPLQDLQVWDLISHELNKSQGLIVFLDALNLEVSGRILERVSKTALPFMCILTKADLLDRWIVRKDLISNVRQRWGLGASIQVMAINLRDRKEIRTLEQHLEGNFGTSARLVLVGGTNVGKTTFLQNLTGCSDLTVSPLPGATQRTIEVSTRQGAVLVDTPGLLLDDPFLPHLCPECLHSLTASRRITRRVFVLRPGQSLMWGGLAWLRIASCGNRDWVKLIAFAPNEVVLHRTRAGREKELLENRSGDLLFPPCEGCLSTVHKLGMSDEDVDLETGWDLTLSNLGWFSVYQGAFRGTVHALTGVQPSVRPFLIPPTQRYSRKGHRNSGKARRRR